MVEAAKKETGPLVPIPPARNVVLEAISAKPKDGASPRDDEKKSSPVPSSSSSGAGAPGGKGPEAHKAAGAQAAQKKSADASPAKSAAPRQASKSSFAEMLLWLDGYDDIFSDFDPRNYEHRELSEDFLKELSRRYKETPKGGFEVHLLIPAHMRQSHLEARIKKRLKHYFARELAGVERQLRKKRETGAKFLASGLLVLALQTWLLFTSQDRFITELIGVLLVPAGWFLTWTGIERVLIEPDNLSSLRDFYKKFFKCEYVFLADENPKKG